MAAIASAGTAPHAENDKIEQYGDSSGHHEVQPDEMKQTVIGAKNASDQEQRMTLLQGVRLYPKAIAFSVVISTCIAMEGYDISLVNNFYGFPPFNRKYGVWSEKDQEYQVPAEWQAGLSNGAACGEIIGLFINGWVSEKIGYRYVWFRFDAVCILGTNNYRLSWHASFS
jgi:MFS transporter, SP family, general alpha glucoside:H+ symporter